MYFTTPKPYAIFVLGAGGTGSWLCAFLDKQSQGNNVIVMDGDVVEDKNILRQNFTRKDPQGQITQVKHGEPGSDLIEITYTIDGTEHKTTVHVSDEKFIKLWYFVREKPLPLSVLDDGDFVVDRYSQK